MTELPSYKSLLTHFSQAGALGYLAARTLYSALSGDAFDASAHCFSLVGASVFLFLRLEARRHE